MQMSIEKINVIRPLASKVLASYFKDRPTGPKHPDFAHDPIGCPAIRDEQQLLEELRDRPRGDGVETVLVNSYGLPWTGDGFGGSFNRVRDEADIVHVDEDTKERKRKHLHDVRGTFCTKLLTEGGISDQEAADIMGWSVAQVSSIRRIYVDDSSLISSIARRMAGGGG